MSEEEQRQLKQICENIGALFMNLRHAASLVHQARWKISPKVHKTQHLHLYCEAINVRHIQCYTEESLVGSCAEIYQRAMRGRYFNDVQSNVLMRRFVALVLKIEL